MVKMTDFVAIYEQNQPKTFNQFTYMLRIRMLGETMDINSTNQQQGMMMEWSETFIK